MKVYLISGLGADSALYTNLQLPGNCEAVHLHWVTPHKTESLQEYAARLGSNISENETFALIGVSLGGMLAVEVARHKKPCALILVSSIPMAKQLPPYYRWAGRLRLHQWLPVNLIKKISVLKRDFSGESDADKKIIRGMIQRSNDFFIKWGLQAILGWSNTEIPANIYSIHGTADEIIPYKYVQPTFTIKGARHLMVLTHGSEVSAIISSILQKACKG